MECSCCDFFIVDGVKKRPYSKTTQYKIISIYHTQQLYF